MTRNRSDRHYIGLLAAVVALAVAALAAGPTRAAAPTMAADSVAALPSAPAGTMAVPADGRLRTDGYDLAVTGVATGPATVAERAGPGQRLWAFGLTAATTTTAAGDSPGALTVDLADGPVMVPVPLQATGGRATRWFLGSLPADGGDVTLSAYTSGTAASPAVFSLSQMARPASPAADYRNASGTVTAATPGPPGNVPTTFTAAENPPVDITVPLVVAVTSAALSYRNPATGNPAPSPGQAWLAVTLSSDATGGAPAGTDTNLTHLIVTQPIPAAAITATVAGQPAVAATDVPGGGGDKGSAAANFNYTDAFPDTYLFAVPATATAVTVTVAPGAFPAECNYGDPTFVGTATPQPEDTAAASTSLTLPTPVTTVSPAGAASQPGTLTVAASRSAGPGAVSPGQRGGTSTGAIVGGVAAAVIVLLGVVVLLLRRPPVTAPAGPPATPTPGWTPLPLPAAPTADWPAPAPTSPPVADPEPSPQPTPEPAGPEDIAEPAPVPARRRAAPEPFVVPAPVALPAPSVRIYDRDPFADWTRPPDTVTAATTALYLAVEGRPIGSDTLRNKVATKSGADLSPATVHSYISRLRLKHLDPGAELASTDRGYHLTGVTTDLSAIVAATRHAKTGDDADRYQDLAAALALASCPPFAGADYRFAADLNLTAPITDAAHTLAAADIDPRLALWACHQALDVTPDQTLMAAALTAAADSGIPGALADEWNEVQRRLTAAGVEADPGLDAHYRRLTHPDAG